MLSGPPGTGKTLLARAIARESGLPFVFASGAEFVESSTGNGSDKIFDIFFTARANVSSQNLDLVIRREWRFILQGTHLIFATELEV